MVPIAAGENYGISQLSVLDNISGIFLGWYLCFRLLLDLPFLRCVVFQPVNGPVFQANSSRFYLTWGIWWHLLMTMEGR